MFKIDREKYISIMRADGIDAALTRLHKDKEDWEFTTFEGNKGYQREGWDDLFKIREFSRELWDISLKQGPVTAGSTKINPGSSST
jgi:hypothetical protein